MPGCDSTGLDPDQRAELRDLRAWLTTVVARLCLDRVRSAAARRERYVGPWLPDPIVTAVDGGSDPLDSSSSTRTCGWPP